MENLQKNLVKSFLKKVHFPRFAQIDKFGQKEKGKISFSFLQFGRKCDTISRGLKQIKKDRI